VFKNYFLSEVATVEKRKEFYGALPTTVYQAGSLKSMDWIQI